MSVALDVNGVLKMLKATTICLQPPKSHRNSSPLFDLTFPDGLHLFAFPSSSILCQFSIVSTFQ